VEPCCRGSHPAVDDTYSLSRSCVGPSTSSCRHICTFLGWCTFFGAAKGEGLDTVVAIIITEDGLDNMFYPLLDQPKVQMNSKGHLAYAMYPEIELPFEFAQINFLRSSSKCKIDVDIKLQLVFDVIHRLVPVSTAIARP
jgi:hypothetical protein